MKTTIIASSSSTPEMTYYPDGHIYMRGKSIPESAWKAFGPAIYWVSKLNNDKIVFHVELEYANSSSVIMLLELFRILEANKKVKMIKVEWHYEDDDNDLYETGQILQDSLGRSEFVFHRLKAQLV